MVQHKAPQWEWILKSDGTHLPRHRALGQGSMRQGMVPGALLWLGVMPSSKTALQQDSRTSSRRRVRHISGLPTHVYT